MKELKVENRSCIYCKSPMDARFFVYVSDNELYDKWLESVDMVEKYCDMCFRDTPKVMLFVEFFCTKCGTYTGIYMECTPYAKAHFLTEISARAHGMLVTHEK